jgi:hypothetical protein
VNSGLEAAWTPHFLIDLAQPVQDDEDDLTAGSQVGGTGRAPSACSLEVGRSIKIAAEDGDGRSGRPGLQKPARDRRGSHSRPENAEHAWKSSPSHPVGVHVKSH